MSSVPSLVTIIKPVVATSSLPTVKSRGFGCPGCLLSFKQQGTENIKSQEYSTCNAIQNQEILFVDTSPQLLELSVQVTQFPLISSTKQLITRKTVFPKTKHFKKTHTSRRQRTQLFIKSSKRDMTDLVSFSPDEHMYL